MRVLSFCIYLAALAFGVSAQASSAQATEPTRLFAADETIRLSIRAELGGIARSDDPRPATLTVEGAAPETHAIQISPRGVSRRRRDICTFPPLRIEFPTRQQAGLFEGQRRLKLVTHCRRSTSHQQYVLLEYAAYRLNNVMTPRSYNVRLAQIDYYDGDASTPSTSRFGFLIEDVDDVAERNGMVEVETGSFSSTNLNAEDAARVAVFQYMIGNLDWSVRDGPQGRDCCHNTRPIGASETVISNLTPLAYDFDHSGLVSAPYATPPAQLRVRSVRQRVFRGFCRHSDQIRAVAGEFRTARPQLEAALMAVPELPDRSQRRALSYLNSFFDEIETPEAVEENLIEECI